MKQFFKRFSVWVSLISFGMMLSACSGSEVKENLGLMRKSPDEFKVVSRPKLSVPPEFHLNPPQEGEQIDFGTNMEEEARTLITNGNMGEVANQTINSSDQQFLKRAGVEKADPNIRKKLRQEIAVTEKEEPDWLDKLRGDTNDDPVVNAKAEQERLKSNKEEGKAMNEGEVPTIDPQAKSTLERLMD